LLSCSLSIADRSGQLKEMRTKAHSKRIGSLSGNWIARPCGGQRRVFVDGTEEPRDQSGSPELTAPNARLPTRTGCDAQTGRAWIDGCRGRADITDCQA
jgi:hypothetical protein